MKPSAARPIQEGHAPRAAPLARQTHGHDLCRQRARRRLGEILDGSAPDWGLLLNRSDAGLLESLGRLSAAEASAQPALGGASIAAHADHLRYDLSLINRWSHGDEPYADADWTTSWEHGTVSKSEWAGVLERLTAEAAAFQQTLPHLLNGDETRQKGTIAAVAHLADHLGAIRQIDRATRGLDAAADHHG